MMIKYLFDMVNQKKRAGAKYWPLLYKINKLIVNMMYPLTQAVNHQCGINPKSDIIVSFTSFPERINYAMGTAASLLNQTVKPCKVVLWLAEGQFPEKKLPVNLTRLCKRGLEIRFCEDLKPHKKYFYTMKEWPEKFVLICDDDMFYPETLVEELGNASRLYPNTIICNKSLTVTYDRDGKLIRRQTHEYGERKGLQVCPVGCGGVLYPPGSLHQAAFDTDAIKENALYQDDVWLKCMSVWNKTPAYNLGQYEHDFFNNLFTQNTGLWKTNIVRSINDCSPNEAAWMKIINRYPEIELILKKDHQSKGGAGNG